MSFDFFSKSGLVEKRPCPVASAPQPKKHKVSASFSDMYAVAKATAKPAVVTQTGLAIKPHARSIVEGGQSTLDTHLPKHAARARQLEEANKAAGALIVRTDGKVLLLQERKYKDKWIQPGGKPDPSDTGPLATATRELWEETRIRLGALKQLGVVDGDQYFRTFVLEAPMNLAVDISHDASVLNYAWLDPATADADMHYRARVLFDKKLVQRFFPQPSKDMVVEEAPAPKPVSNSPQVAKGQTFTEILSLDALQYLCKLKYSDFLKVFPQPEMDKTGHIDTLPEQYQMMKDFCKSAQQHGKQVTVGDVQAVEIERAYLPTQSSPSGRVFASGDQSTGLALQRLWTKVRSVLTREFTVDIDMKNAHPTILRNLCESEFPHEEFWHPLNNYVDRRQEVLNELQSAGIQQPKIVILKSMNSEWSVNKVFKRPIPKKCEKYYALDGCFKTIQKRLEKLPKYKDLHPDKRTPNHRGVFLNKILCQSENALLQEAMQLVGGSRVVAPMFDGMLVRGQPKDVPALLTKLNERFKNRIVWDHKEHDNDIQVNLEYEGLPCYIADTDVTLMDHLVGHFSGKLARCRSALWFVGETCTTVILPGDRTQGALFEHHVIAELRLCEVFIGEHNQCDSMAALRSLCSSLMVQAPIDPEFETKYWTSNPDDNYSRGIRMWNERCIHLLQKSVFLYEESGEVEELKPDELQRNMRALTDVTFDQWCASSQRRAYDKDVFVPTLVTAQQNPRHYNRFKGLDIQYKDCSDADVSACEPLLMHIREILCNGNEAATEFVLKTFARIIQGVEKGHLHWIKSQVCMIFLSKPGAGKGTVTRHFRRILGASNAKQVCKKKDVFGNFNDLCSCKLWVELDELLWAGNHEQAGEFKNMITEDTQTCEGKHKKTREFDSYHNYCATTNSDWAAQVDGDDRRFAAIDCDDRWAGPRTAAKTEYFARLNDPRQGPYNITLAFARYLYDLDVDNFEPAAHIPTETDGLRQQKLQSLNPVAALVLQWLERARVIPYTDECDHAELKNWPEILSDDLWAIVRRECQSVRNFPDSPHKFFTALGKILPGCVTTRKGKARICHKSFTTLTICRADMNAYLGFQYFNDDPECEWLH